MRRRKKRRKSRRGSSRRRRKRRMKRLYKVLEGSNPTWLYWGTTRFDFRAITQ